MEQLEELIHSLYSKMNIKCFPFMDYGTKVTVKAYGPFVNNISCFTVFFVFFVATKPYVALTSFDSWDYVMFLFFVMLKEQRSAQLTLPGNVIQYKLLLWDLAINSFVMHATRTHFLQTLCLLTIKFDLFA